MDSDQSILFGRLKKDFPFFLVNMWHATGLADVAPLTELDMDMAHWIQTGPRKRGIRAFRGVGKTAMFTCAYGAYRLRRNPDMRIKIVSKKHQHAMECVSWVRNWLDTVWFLQDLRPDENKRHRDKEDRFDVGPTIRTKDPSVMAVGIEGMITGTRAHLLLVDDIETLENTKTVSAREWLRKQVSEFTKVASFTESGAEGNGMGDIVVLGTPHHEESIYDNMTERGYEFRSYPIMLPPPSGDFGRGKINDLAPIICRRINEYEAEHGPVPEPPNVIPTVPERFGESKILDEMADGIIGFAQQMMLISQVGDGFRYLKLSDLIVPDFDFRDGRVPIWIKWGVSNHDGSTAWESIENVSLGHQLMHRQIAMPNNPDDWMPITDVKMRIDPSGGGDDETAWAIGGFLAGYIWVMEVTGRAAGYDERHGADETIMHEIADRARTFGVRVINIESNFGQEMFAQILRPIVQMYFTKPKDPAWPQYPDGWRCSVVSEPAGGGEKGRRIINALSPVMIQHRLVVHPDCLRPTEGLRRHYELQYQITAIRPKANSIPHDDRVEVLSKLIADFMYVLHAAPEDMSSRLTEERIEEMERKFETMNGMASGDDPRWVRFL